MNTGRVKWFNQSKGFGFIEHEDGRNVFVSFTSLKSKEDPKPKLREGQSVRYQVRESFSGPEAIEVELITIERPHSLSGG